MSLSLSTFTAASPAGPLTGSAGTGAGSQAGASGGFAGLLRLVASVADAALPGPPIATLAVNALVGPGEDGTATGEAITAEETSDQPAATATASDGAPLLAQLASVLARIEAANARGGDLDPALVAELDGVVAGLAAALGLAPDATAGKPVEAGADPTLLQRLVGRAADIAGGLADGEALAGRLNAVLGALNTLGDGTLPEGLLAKLGLDGTGEPAGRLKGMLEAIAAPRAEAPPPPTGPALADAGLRMPQRIAAPAAPSAGGGGAGSESDPGTPRMKLVAVDAAKSVEAANDVDAPDLLAKAPEAMSATGQAAQPAAAAAGKAALPQPYTAPHVNLPAVAIEIARQFRQGATRFEIRLDPPELGRIDVRLDMDQSGNLNARLAVERPETLDLFQRDQRALERALAQAGLDTGKTSLEFSLKQFDRQPGGGGQGEPRWSADASGGAANGAGDDTAGAMTTLYRGSAQAGALNIFV